MPSVFPVGSRTRPGGTSAMGLLSMAIGGLPIGMYGLGELAQHIGAPAALTIFNVVGFVVLGVFLRRRPEAWHQQ